MSAPGPEAECVAVLSGILDAAGAASVEAAARGPLARLRDGGVLVLDMAGVTYVDSAGLGALLSCLRQAEAADVRVVFRGCTAQVAALLHLARFDLAAGVEAAA